MDLDEGPKEKDMEKWNPERGTGLRGKETVNDEVASETPKKPGESGDEEREKRRGERKGEKRRWAGHKQEACLGLK